MTACEKEVLRLREALRHAQGRFLNINICLTSGGTKHEAIGIADVGEDCIKMALARDDSASATSAFGQDPQGLEAKPASAAPSGETPQ